MFRNKNVRFIAGAVAAALALVVAAVVFIAADNSAPTRKPMVPGGATAFETPISEASSLQAEGNREIITDKNGQHINERGQTVIYLGEKISCLPDGDIRTGDKVRFMPGATLPGLNDYIMDLTAQKTIALNLETGPRATFFLDPRLVKGASRGSGSLIGIKPTVGLQGEILDISCELTGQPLAVIVIEVSLLGLCNGTPYAVATNGTLADRRVTDILTMDHGVEKPCN